MVKILFVSSFLLLSQAQAFNCKKLITSLLNLKTSPYKGVPEYKLLKKIDKIEEQSNFLRELRGNDEPNLKKKVEREIATQDVFLLDGRYARANRKWRPLFRKVEVAYIIIKKNKKVLKALDNSNYDASVEELRKSLKAQKLNQSFIDMIIDQYNKAGKSTEKLKKNIQKIINKELVSLGSNYYRYARIRYHLEDLLDETNCNEICRTNVKRMLDSMGVKSYKEQASFSRIIGRESRPSIKEISNTLNESPLARLTSVKLERNAEIPFTLKKFILRILLLTDFVEKVMSFPPFSTKAWVQVFKLIYDDQARTLHFPVINKVVRSTNSIKDKYYMLKGEATARDGDEVLITFARRVDQQTHETWNEILDYAKTNSPEFYRKMQEAIPKAKARGGISLLNKETPISRTAIYITAGISFIGYQYFKTDSNNVSSEEVESSDSTLETSVEEKVEIQLGGEEDQIIDEIVQVLRDYEKTGKLVFENHLSISKRKPASKRRPAKFTRWFKSLFP